MKRTTLAAWIGFGVIAVSVVWAVALDAAQRQTADGAPSPVVYLIPVTFALVGAVILSRQPGNRVGVLLLLPGLSFFVLVDAYLQPLIDGSAPLPPTLTPALWLALWYSNWNWTLLIFPLMWLMVLFPSGRPIGRRWGWLVWFGVFLTALLFLLATLGTPIAPGCGCATWSYANPIGLIPATAALIQPLLALFTILVPLWVVLCLAALVARDRRAGQVERQQIKWLLFAMAVFAAAYVPLFIFSDFDNLWNVLWMLAMLLIPAAIGLAILRYRLFDIDVIIRKTLVYAVLSGLLALLYFGAVILLQSVFEVVSDQQSPLVIVISTLLIAALFAPLRRRVQAFIDRRFYRQKYDAQQVLAQFAQAARDETDVDKLAARLSEAVQETMQPDGVSLWLKPVIPNRGGNL